jgi:hypothetical protein
MCGKLLSMRVCGIGKFVQVPSSALVKSVGSLDFTKVSPFFIVKIIGYTFLV